MFEHIADREYKHGAITPPLCILLSICAYAYAFADEPWREFANIAFWICYCTIGAVLLICGYTNRKKILEDPFFKKCKDISLYFIAPFVPHIYLYAQMFWYLLKH